jgi:hypothetical protein
MSGEQETPTTGPLAEVVIAIPAGDMVATYFMYDLARMMTWTALNLPRIKLNIIIATGSLIPRQREQLVDITLDKTQATHMLFLDSDMRFPKDLIPRLLRHEAPAVCASYTERSEPFRPVAFPNSKNYGERVWTYPDSTGTERIEACGFGVMMLSTEMLRKLEKPRFLVGYTKNENGTGQHVGEDIYFFYKMQEQGIALLMDHDVTKDVRHIGRFEFGPAHALEYLAQHPELDKRPKKLIEVVS